MLIVGLGNKGKKYELTYHNAGFMAIDELAKNFKLNVAKKELNSLIGVKYLSDEKIVLAKPQTFMNLSAQSVALLLPRYCKNISELIVIYDDIEVPLGKIRLRRKGSAGTHNGMRDIVSEIGEDFIRIRIGIGRPENQNVPIMDYVLSKISNDRLAVLNKVIKAVADELEKYSIKKDLDLLERNLNNLDLIDCIVN